MPYQDQTLTCRDCNKTFVFTAGAQEFYAQKGYTNAPTRCKDCRVIRKKTTEANANKQLYKIVCKSCGKQGEMATEPRKPNDVLCSECFYRNFQSEQGNNPKGEVTNVEHAEVVSEESGT
jgi:CxxC-x17-CxxC domain-containing protein